MRFLHVILSSATVMAQVRDLSRDLKFTQWQLILSTSFTQPKSNKIILATPPVYW